MGREDDSAGTAAAGWHSRAFFLPGLYSKSGIPVFDFGKDGREINHYVIARLADCMINRFGGISLLCFNEKRRKVIENGDVWSIMNMVDQK